MGSYQHEMDDFKKRPLEIKKHLLEVHAVTPKVPTRQSYSREVWRGQHELDHRHRGIEKHEFGTPLNGSWTHDEPTPALEAATAL